MNGNSSFKVQEFYDWVYSYGDPSRTPQAEAERAVRLGHRPLGINPDLVTVQVLDKDRRGMDNTSTTLSSPALTEAEQHTSRYSVLLLKREDLVRRIRECYFSQMDQKALTELASELGLVRGKEQVYLETPEAPLEEAIKRVVERSVEMAKGWLKAKADALLAS